MFTGIITDLGEVLAIESTPQGKRMEIATAYDVNIIALGASIAHDGACMTVVEKPSANSYIIEISPESLDCTTLGAWKVGSKINLERPVAVGGEFGGHFVTGHVDAVGEVVSIDNSEANDFWELVISYPEKFGIYLAAKGSVAINGVSLTVNAVNRAERSFSLMIIPHTLQETNLSELKAGSKINLEADLIARYLLAQTLEKEAS